MTLRKKPYSGLFFGLSLFVALVTNVHAQGATPWYIGGGVSRLNGSSTAGDINANLNRAGITATASSVDDQRSGWRLFSGYRANPNFALEVGYIDLGKGTTTIQSSASDIDSLVANIGELNPRTAEGLSLSFVFHHKINSHLHLFGHFGLYRWRADYDLATTSAMGTSSVRIDKSGIDPIFGVGVESPLWQELWGRINLERIKVEQEEINSLSLELFYLFDL